LAVPEDGQFFNWPSKFLEFSQTLEIIREQPGVVAKYKLESQGPEFEALLSWLNPDRDCAGDEYVRLHCRLAKIFEARGCLGPEECADETFNRVARQLLEGKEIRTDKPAIYLDGVARLVLREQWGKPAPELIEEVPADKLPEDPNVEVSAKREKERWHVCLEMCLQRLPPESRQLLLEYYSEEKTRKIETRSRMARQLGVATSVLRNRIFKLRNSLRGCVATCLAR
jgi:DNA-directed RNA polymerase specialized sigma24 family protein